MSTPKTPLNGCPKSNKTPRSPLKGQSTVQPTLTSFVNRVPKRKEIEDPEQQGASKIPKPTNIFSADQTEMEAPSTEKNNEATPAAPTDLATLLQAISANIDALQKTTNDIKQSTTHNQNESQAAIKNLSSKMTLMDVKLDQISAECLRRTEAVEAKIKALEEKIENMEKAGTRTGQTEEAVSMAKALELLRIEARANNLIIYGLAEQEEEGLASLSNEIAEIFALYYGVPKPHFSNPTRLKTADPFRPRPVRVCFQTRQQRNAILFKRPKDCPIYVKADYPPETAKKQKTFGLLYKQAKEEKKSCKRFDTFVVVDGKQYDFEEAKKYLEENRRSGTPSPNYSVRSQNSNNNNINRS